MKSTTVLWSSPPYLCNDFNVLERRWAVLSRLTKGGKIRSLKMRILDDFRTIDEFQRRWKQSIVFKTFPFETLQEFHYSGYSMIIDGLIWDTITQCTDLKAIQWQSFFLRAYSQPSSNYEIPQKEPTDYMYPIQGTPLANCKLDTFRIFVNYQLILDEAYLDLLSNVKRLHIKQGTDWKRLSTILDGAKDTLEDLALANNRKNDPDLVGVFEMPKLQKYKTVWPWRGDHKTFSRGPTIKTKNLTSIVFKQTEMIDWDLVEANRANLKKLYVFLMGEVDPRIESELLDMPQVEILDLRYGKHCTEDESTAISGLKNFWQSIENGFTTKPDVPMEQILPKLKKMTLLDDPIMTPKLMIKFLQERSRLGLPALKSLTVYCGEQHPFSKGEQRRVKAMVGDFWFEEHDEWEDRETSSDEDLYIRREEV
jgi:hypothetical protein